MADSSALPAKVSPPVHQCWEVLCAALRIRRCIAKRMVAKKKRRLLEAQRREQHKLILPDFSSSGHHRNSLLWKEVVVFVTRPRKEDGTFHSFGGRVVDTESCAMAFDNLIGSPPADLLRVYFSKKQPVPIKFDESVPKGLFIEETHDGGIFWDNGIQPCDVIYEIQPVKYATAQQNPDYSYQVLAQMDFPQQLKFFLSLEEMNLKILRLASLEGVSSAGRAIMKLSQSFANAVFEEAEATCFSAFTEEQKNAIEACKTYCKTYSDWEAATSGPRGDDDTVLDHPRVVHSDVLELVGSRVFDKWLNLNSPQNKQNHILKNSTKAVLEFSEEQKREIEKCKKYCQQWARKEAGLDACGSDDDDDDDDNDDEPRHYYSDVLKLVGETTFASWLILNTSNQETCTLKESTQERPPTKPTKSNKPKRGQGGSTKKQSAKRALTEERQQQIKNNLHALQAKKAAAEKAAAEEAAKLAAEEAAKLAAEEAAKLAAAAKKEAAKLAAAAKREAAAAKREAAKLAAAAKKKAEEEEEGKDEEKEEEEEEEEAEDEDEDEDDSFVLTKSSSDDDDDDDLNEPPPKKPRLQKQQGPPLDETTAADALLSFFQQPPAIQRKFAGGKRREPLSPPRRHQLVEGEAVAHCLFPKTNETPRRNVHRIIDRLNNSDPSQLRGTQSAYLKRVTQCKGPFCLQLIDPKNPPKSKEERGKPKEGKKERKGLLGQCHFCNKQGSHYCVGCGLFFCRHTQSRKPGSKKFVAIADPTDPRRKLHVWFDCWLQSHAEGLGLNVLNDDQQQLAFENQPSPPVELLDENEE